MSINLMNPIDGQLMEARTKAVNSALDSNNNLVVRINSGNYKKKAASGYPEVYLENEVLNRYMYTEYFVACVGFQGGYSSTGPIPEHSYVYINYKTSAAESGRLQGHPYIIGDPQPGNHDDNDILGVGFLKINEKTGQNYQTYIALSRIKIVYSNNSTSLSSPGTVYEPGQSINLNPGCHMFAKV